MSSGHRWGSMCVLYHPPASGVHLPGWNLSDSPHLAPKCSWNAHNVIASDSELPAHGNTCLKATGGWTPSDRLPRIALSPAGGQKAWGTNSQNWRPHMGPWTPLFPEQLRLIPLLTLERAHCCQLATTAVPATQSRKIHWIPRTCFSDKVSSWWWQRGNHS